MGVSSSLSASFNEKVFAAAPAAAEHLAIGVGVLVATVVLALDPIAVVHLAIGVATSFCGGPCKPPSAAARGVLCNLNRGFLSCTENTFTCHGLRVPTSLHDTECVRRPRIGIYSL